MPTQRDYYEILGVERDSSSDDIKRAYRKRAMKFHPDRNPGDAEAEEKFKEAAEAYQILSDDEKRRMYDQYGHQGVNQNMGGRGFGSFEEIFSAFGDIFGSAGQGGGSIFDEFFGFGGGRQAGAQRRRGASLKCEISISLPEAAQGTKRTIQVTRAENCGTCHGSGAAAGTSPSVCPYCHGMRQVQQSQGFFSIRTTCPRCRGEGEVIETPCKKCRGAGREKANREITVEIPPGVETGTQLRITGEGEPGPRGGPRGDLYVFVVVEPHSVFERQADDLLLEVPVGFAKLTLGTSIDIPTLDGKAELQIPKGTKSHRVFRLRGKGMPRLRGSGAGDLLVRTVADTPKKLTKRQEQLLKELAEIEDKNVSAEQKSFLDKMKDLFGS